jgi:hypothetical protein
MKYKRQTITISYRIVDASGHTLEVVQETGLNKRYLLWKVERYVSKKYGKGIKIHPFKIREEN